MKKHLARILLLAMCLMVFAGVKPMEASAAGESVRYWITSKVANVANAGTNSNKVHFTFYGTDGKLYLDNMGKRITGNAFKKNATDTYYIDTPDIGQIYGLNVSCGIDGVKYEYIKIEREYGGKREQVAYFTINEWVDDTNKNYYTNRENIYRIKVVTADNPLDGTANTISLDISDSAGKSFNAFKMSNLTSGTECSFVVLASQKLSDIRYITLTNTSGSTNPDTWRPSYIQVERMSTTTDSRAIKWNTEVLFVPDQAVGSTPVKVERYDGVVKNDQASGLASIFFDPNFYVITTIIVLMSGAGVGVYVKKKTEVKEKVR